MRQPSRCYGCSGWITRRVITSVVLESILPHTFDADASSPGSWQTVAQSPLSYRIQASCNMQLFALLLLLAISGAFAATGPTVSQGDPRMPGSSLPEAITPLTIQQAELELKTAQLRLESLKLQLDTAKQREDEAAQQLEWMKSSLEAATTDAQRGVLKDALARQQARLDEARKQRQDTENSIAQTQTNIRRLEDRLERLRDAYAQQQDASLLADLKRLEERSAREIDQLNAQVKRLVKELAALPPDKKDRKAILSAQIDAAENRIFITQTRLKLATARSALDHLTSIPRQTGAEDIELIAADLKKTRQISQDLQPVIGLLSRKLDLIRSQRQVTRQKIQAGQLKETSGRRIDDMLAESQRQLEEQLDEARHLLERVTEIHQRLTEAYRRLLNADLSARQRLPDRVDLWPSLGREIIELPRTTGRLLLQELSQLPNTVRTRPEETTIAAVFLIVGMVIAGLSYHYRMRGTRRRALEAKTFSGRIAAIALHILRGISIPASLLIGVVGGLWVIAASPLLMQLIALFLGIWMAIRLLSDLSYWFLVSPLVSADDDERRLHRGIVLNVWTSGLLGLLLGLGKLGVISEPLSVVVNRLFMFSLLPAVYLSFRLRNLVVSRLRDHGTTGYWLWVVRMVSLLLPLAMLGIAAPGLAGYFNLASLVAWYLIATLSVVTLWLVLRGLLADLVHRWAEYVERDERHGTLWYEGLIRPLHLLARVLLAVLIIIALIKVYGLGDQSTLFALLRGILSYPLFTIGDTTIDLAHLGISALVALGAFPAGAWVRRLSFDWLYAGVTDRGIRNSLAVFTQYSTVLIGLLLAINLLGIDLTSLAVFAGALGVGIGFGLQNIANNFISGLILLVERPIRAGDWVTVGNYEGEITYIGIRSATVRTWDNQEVIIPNAELISNAFTNWTRSDPVVRTVLKVGISYDGDPHQAQKIIEEAVTMQPEVLLQPAPRILLSDFGDSSVDFRITYYMDVSQFSRLEIKSKVMFAIWDALKEADIEIPFPQRDIHIREVAPHTADRATAIPLEQRAEEQPA
ncbi:MAG: hypothetical protein D6720_06410 [Gammaproteobacteria bacterium]|nr:MAG: hypothetical protein D6720_06410 [Gammaproteobacteria bacterium]